tara:strand:- start:593 stop:976 length:384 start_codon:yes stop_codon:yes gene_type:complete
VPSTHSFIAGDKINAIGFFATAYNVEQTVSSVSSTTVVTDLNSSALSDPTVYGTLESMQDFVNAGWRQYVCVDSAIMMMLKEESDISGLVYVKQGLLERIEIMAEDRDSGEPARVTNVAAYEQYFMY